MCANVQGTCAGPSAEESQITGSLFSLSTTLQGTCPGPSAEEAKYRFSALFKISLTQCTGLYKEPFQDQAVTRVKTSYLFH